MVLKILSIIFALMVVVLLSFYWFFPFNTIEFYTDLSSNTPKNSNFSLFDSKNQNSNMQFYENMRYSEKEISYRIFDCPLYKENEIIKAFNRIENLTIINFYPVDLNEEISATCKDRGKINKGTFVAGEGGPINITKTENFNVIFNGEILLIREPNCPDPNVATHEILHALGFDHSSNPSNIMYNITKCGQTVGADTIKKINELYSVPSQPDLGFENISAVMNGKYLDTNVSIRNQGLEYSENSKLKIYADEKLIKEIEIKPIKIGYGITLTLENVWIPKLNVKELIYEIEYNSEELNKNNNKIKLEIKN